MTGTGASSSTADPAARDIVVETTDGLVRGYKTHNVFEFRAIPYAGPIGGDRRFRAPRPAESWSGVMDARTWPPMAPQAFDRTAPTSSAYYRSICGVDYQSEQAEDGLYLNLWTPTADEPGRPVVVWLHGGAFDNGAATRPRENGAAWSGAEDLVVVAPTHRVGIAGYLWLGDLATGYDANVGMQDIVAALRWVATNISRFGGDPENVIVMGELGGSIKAATLLTMPTARGLFHKLICQCGANPIGAVSLPDSRERARELALAVLGSLNVDRTEIDRLAEIPLPALVAGVRLFRTPDREFLLWGISPVDETVIVGTPIDSIRSGRAPRVPLLIGTAAHEMRFILHSSRRPTNFAELERSLGTGGAVLVTHYSAKCEDGTVEDVQERILTDGVFRIPASALAEVFAEADLPVYMYLVEWQNRLRPDLGCSHGIETPLVLRNVNTVEVTATDASSTRLSKIMSNAWGSYCRTGKPSFGGRFNNWHTYDSTTRDTAVFSTDASIVSDPYADDRRVWGQVHNAIKASQTGGVHSDPSINRR